MQVEIGAWAEENSTVHFGERGACKTMKLPVAVACMALLYVARAGKSHTIKWSLFMRAFIAYCARFLCIDLLACCGHANSDSSCSGKCSHVSCNHLTSMHSSSHIAYRGSTCSVTTHRPLCSSLYTCTNTAMHINICICINLYCISSLRMYGKYWLIWGSRSWYV